MTVVGTPTRRPRAACVMPAAILNSLRRDDERRADDASLGTTLRRLPCVSGYAYTAGGRQVRDVLNNLAAAAYAEAESKRRIDVARERPRAAMRYTAIIIATFVALLVAFSRRYLEPYETAAGQLVLAVVAAYWAAGFWWMHRMGRAAPVERFLAAPVAEVTP